MYKNRKRKPYTHPHLFGVLLVSKCLDWPAVLDCGSSRSQCYAFWLLAACCLLYIFTRWQCCPPDFKQKDFQLFKQSVLVTTTEKLLALFSFISFRRECTFISYWRNKCSLVSSFSLPFSPFGSPTFLSLSLSHSSPAVYWRNGKYCPLCHFGIC